MLQCKPIKKVSREHRKIFMESHVLLEKNKKSFVGAFSFSLF